jgi:hypothetical protein
MHFDLSAGIEFDSHALSRMEERSVSRTQVLEAFHTFHISYLAPRLGHSIRRSAVIIAIIDNRPLKVYVLEDSHPPYVHDGGMGR